MGSKIIIAADDLAGDTLISLVTAIGNRAHAIKIHDEFDLYGQDIVARLLDAGAPAVWVDFKFHDIPATAERRARAVAKSGANILTVHASGGVDMMLAAREGAPDAELFAVTVLTSLSDDNILRIYNRTREQQVLNLAALAKDAQMDGIVCSAQEVAIVSNSAHMPDMKYIVPGIRSAGKDVHDQKRVGTPVQAVRDGASFLVIGRQITQAPNPIQALEEIENELLLG